MVFLLAIFLFAQNYEQRGFVESQFTLYPRETQTDSGRFIGDALVRYEAFYKLIDDLEIAGAVDLRMDTHHQVERDWRLSWQDREVQRPIAAIRNLRALYNRGNVTLEAGKQFVRWGKADIVTPTDRFAPKDFLTVVDSEFLAITAVRATYERGANTMDAVWSPRFTPSRIPLQNQRWFNAPAGSAALRNVVEFPRGEEIGFRFSHVGQVEFALSFYRGFNHAPSFEFRPAGFTLERFYPKLQMFGGDAAVSLPWLTLKAEVAHFHSPDTNADDYAQVVVQVERQTGEWSFVGGYAGEVITKRGPPHPSFDPDRGLTRTLIGRAGYTIDANRSVATEAAVRQNGDGVWAKFEYSQAFGQHWRLTTGIAVIGGNETDFLANTTGIRTDRLC